MNTREIFLSNLNLFGALRGRAGGSEKEREQMPTYPLPAKGSLYFRGGSAVEEDGNVRVVSVPNYGVVARYTEQENKKVLEAVKLLTKIANGDYEDRDSKIETFSDRVQRNFLNQEGEDRSFGQAVFDSTTECYELFARLHPEETPCLHAIFLTAGSGGNQLSVTLCSGFLDAAISGHLNDTNVGVFKELPNGLFARTFIDGDNSDDFFNQLIASKLTAYMRKVMPPHLASAMPGLERSSEIEPIQQIALYERQCSGMSFAKRIIGQSADAALKLSKSQEVIDWHKQYGSNFLTSVGQDFSKLTEDKIKEIFERAKSHFEVD